MPETVILYCSDTCLYTSGYSVFQEVCTLGKDCQGFDHMNNIFCNRGDGYGRVAWRETYVRVPPTVSPAASWTRGGGHRCSCLKADGMVTVLLLL
jgi:hypothetical protein